MLSPFVRAISLEFLYINGEYLVSYTLKSGSKLFLPDLFSLSTQSNNHDVLKIIIK